MKKEMHKKLSESKLQPIDAAKATTLINTFKSAIKLTDEGTEGYYLHKNQLQVLLEKLGDKDGILISFGVGHKFSEEHDAGGDHRRIEKAMHLIFRKATVNTKDDDMVMDKGEILSTFIETLKIWTEKVSNPEKKITHTVTPPSKPPYGT